MFSEDQIQQELVKKFNFLEGKVLILRPRRIKLEVSPENFFEVLEFVLYELEFRHLCTITGLDDKDRLSILYHLAQEKGKMLNIKLSVPKSYPVIKSIISYFPGAEVYERELVDLLGARVEGLPPGNRYPLTDDWPAGEYPLRKDWRPKYGAEKGS